MAGGREDAQRVNPEQLGGAWSVAIVASSRAGRLSEVPASSPDPPAQRRRGDGCTADFWDQSGSRSPLDVDPTTVVRIPYALNREGR